MSDTEKPPAGDMTTQALDGLRRRIIAGELMPNEHLAEASLAADLGVNRVNIRMALSVLENEGLVVRERNRGARVRRLTEKEAVEIDEIRIVLEALVARKAALRAGPDDIVLLQGIVDAMDAKFAGGDYEGAAALNGDLHDAILDVADNETLHRIVAGLKYRLVRAQFRRVIVPAVLKRSIREHREVVDAIASRDPEAAENAMTAHLETVLANLRRLIEPDAASS